MLFWICRSYRIVYLHNFRYCVETWKKKNSGIYFVPISSDLFVQLLLNTCEVLHRLCLKQSRGTFEVLLIGKKKINRKKNCTVIYKKRFYQSILEHTIMKTKCCYVCLIDYYIIRCFFLRVDCDDSIPVIFVLYVFLFFSYHFQCVLLVCFAIFWYITCQFYHDRLLFFSINPYIVTVLFVMILLFLLKTYRVIY